MSYLYRMHVCMHICMCACMCACMYTCTYAQMYACMYALVYVCTYVFMSWVFVCNECTTSGDWGPKAPAALTCAYTTCKRYDHRTSRDWETKAPYSRRGNTASNRRTSKPHETTTKPLTKPLDFYHTFHETSGFYKYYLYLGETFFSIERWFRGVVDKIRVVSWLVSWWFRVVSWGIMYFPEMHHNTQNSVHLSGILCLFSRSKGKVKNVKNGGARHDGTPIHQMAQCSWSQGWEHPFCVCMYVLCVWINVRLRM